MWKPCNIYEAKMRQLYLALNEMQKNMFVFVIKIKNLIKNSVKRRFFVFISQKN